MKLMLIVFAAALLFGCTGETIQPENNATNETEIQPPPVSIIIEEQKNQTQEDITPPSPPAAENETETTDIQYEFEPDIPMGIFFIDVSGSNLHGNAILIKKGDLDILVDAGPEQNKGKTVDLLKSRRVDDIDLLISTSADPRMYGALEAVMDNFEVEHFWWNGKTFRNQEYTALIGDIQEKVKETRIVSRGDRISLNGLELEILNPSELAFDDVNNDAIVLKITDRNVSILLTSGVQRGATQKMTNEIASKIKSDILQAPYFGTGEGTRDIGLFLLASGPENVIITGSSDDSPANGGSREPFERLLAQYNIGWYNQYELGTIRITSNGYEYAIQNISS
ncbi:MBL fold metallo-hydrolase [Candidatus Micrarchaeota archaeon]|nr:MBL fold metallo-hydrolase [Candidatus Micrarchaeota archaeon]